MSSATKFSKDGFTYYKINCLGSEISNFVDILANPPKEYHSVDDMEVEEAIYD